MTNEYRKNTHTIFQIEVHIIWVTKYRYKVLTGDIAERTRELVRRICEENRAQIVSGVVFANHVHILLSIDNGTSLSTLMKYIKGKTSHQLQMEFASLRKQYWGQRLWARGYFAVSVGNVSDQMVKDYIEHHFDGTEGDVFRIA